MKIYAVQFDSDNDKNEVMGHFLTEEDAEARAAELERQNPGFGFYVVDIDVY